MLIYANKKELKIHSIYFSIQIISTARMLNVDIRQ